MYFHFKGDLYNMANTLEAIIAELEKTAQTPETPATPVAETPAQPKNDELTELRKLAADLDAQGRQIARGFLDEIQKVAVGVDGMTPNTAAVPENPAVQVSNQDVRLEDTAKVEAIIKKLTLGGEAKVNPAGVIHEQNTPVAPTQPIVVDETPVAADVKQASAEIIEKLYKIYFTE